MVVCTHLYLIHPPDLSTEMKAVLDKHSVALEKQKENTTKLSKLCLGTLNELEKFEKKAEQACWSHLNCTNQCWSLGEA